MLHLNSLNGCLCNRYRTSFSPKYPLTTIRRRFISDELQIVRGEAEDTFIVRPHKSGF